jgi:hypothetical protein
MAISLSFAARSFAPDSKFVSGRSDRIPFPQMLTSEGERGII